MNNAMRPNFKAKFVFFHICGFRKQCMRLKGKTPNVKRQGKMLSKLTLSPTLPW